MDDGFRTYASDMVAEFIEAFDSPRDPVLWKNLMVEEAKEFIEAETAEQEVKECMDFMYVCAGYGLVTTVETDVKGTDYELALFHQATQLIGLVSVSLGTMDKFYEAFRRVHVSNMSKLGEDGKPIRREDGKILKGPNYEPPYLDDLVYGE